jgi:hypothetical protein
VTEENNEFQANTKKALVVVRLFVAPKFGTLMAGKVKFVFPRTNMSIFFFQ